MERYTGFLMRDLNEQKSSAQEKVDGLRRFDITCITKIDCLFGAKKHESKYYSIGGFLLMYSKTHYSCDLLIVIKYEFHNISFIEIRWGC